MDFPYLQIFIHSFINIIIIIIIIIIIMIIIIIIIIIIFIYVSEWKYLLITRHSFAKTCNNPNKHPLYIQNPTLSQLTNHQI